MSAFGVLARAAAPSGEKPAREARFETALYGRRCLRCFVGTET